MVHLNREKDGIFSFTELPERVKMRWGGGNEENDKKMYLKDNDEVINIRDLGIVEKVYLSRGPASKRQFSLLFKAVNSSITEKALHLLSDLTVPRDGKNISVKLNMLADDLFDNPSHHSRLQIDPCWSP